MFKLVKLAGMLIFHLLISLRWLTTEKEPRGTWKSLCLTYFLSWKYSCCPWTWKTPQLWLEGGHGVQVSLSQITSHPRQEYQTGPNYNRCFPRLPLLSSCVCTYPVFLRFSVWFCKSYDEDGGGEREHRTSNAQRPRLFTRCTADVRNEG